MPISFGPPATRSGLHSVGEHCGYAFSSGSTMLALCAVDLKTLETPRHTNPTSAVRRGQGRSFGHLGEKSPLHFGDLGDRRRHAEALREVEAEPVEERRLSGIRTHDTAQTELTTILGGQHDVGALNAP